MIAVTLLLSLIYVECTTEIAHAHGLRTVMTYDAIGQRSTMRDPDNGRFSYYWDAVGQISSLRNPQSERTTFTNDVLGRRTVTKQANLVRASMTYDAADRMVTLANVRADGTYVSRYDYAHDNTQNKTRVQEADGNRVTWSYDPTYQLTRERRSGANAYDVTYTYDAASNRRLEINSNARTTYSCDAANQLQWTQDGTGRTTYSYDQAGNQTQQMTPALARTTQVWDGENRMTQVKLSTGLRSTYTYNADKLRVQKDDSSGRRIFVQDSHAVLLEADEGGATVAKYTVLPYLYGTLLAQRRGVQTNYYHYDDIGSTQQLTNTVGATTDSYVNKYFGVSLVASGATENNYRYASNYRYYYDSDTQNYLAIARYYRPFLGLFVPMKDRYYISRRAFVTNLDELVNPAKLGKLRLCCRSVVDSDYYHIGMCITCPGEAMGCYDGQPRINGVTLECILALRALCVIAGGHNPFGAAQLQIVSQGKDASESIEPDKKECIDIELSSNVFDPKVDCKAIRDCLNKLMGNLNRKCCFGYALFAKVSFNSNTAAYWMYTNCILNHVDNSEAEKVLEWLNKCKTKGKGVPGWPPYPGRQETKDDQTPLCVRKGL